MFAARLTPRQRSSCLQGQARSSLLERCARMGLPAPDVAWNVTSGAYGLPLLCANGIVGAVTGTDFVHQPSPTGMMLKWTTSTTTASIDLTFNKTTTYFSAVAEVYFSAAETHCVLSIGSGSPFVWQVSTSGYLQTVNPDVAVRYTAGTRPMAVGETANVGISNNANNPSYMSRDGYTVCSATGYGPTATWNNGGIGNRKYGTSYMGTKGLGWALVWLNTLLSEAQLNAATLAGSTLFQPLPPRRVFFDLASGGGTAYSWALGGEMPSASGVGTRATVKGLSGASPGAAGAIASSYTARTFPAGVLPAPAGAAVKLTARVLGGLIGDTSGGTSKITSTAKAGSFLPPSAAIGTSYRTEQAVSGAMGAILGAISWLVNEGGAVVLRATRIIGAGFRRLIGG